MKESSFVNRSSWWDGSDSYKNYDCKTVCLINAGSDCKQPVTFLTATDRKSYQVQWVFNLQNK